jgi:hypothetical protein
MSFDTVNHRVYVTNHFSPLVDMLWTISGGVYENVPCEEVNTPFAYWLIDSWGDTAGIYNLEAIGSDTLHFNPTHLGNSVTLVRTDRWQTYLCSDMGLDIVMHATKNDMLQPPQYVIAQMNSNAFSKVDCIWPFGSGRFAMVRRGIEGDADIPTYGLTLDFTPFSDDPYNYVLEDYTIQGEPIEDDQFTIIPGFGSCSSQYTFLRQ